MGSVFLRDSSPEPILKEISLNSSGSFKTSIAKDKDKLREMMTEFGRTMNSMMPQNKVHPSSDKDEVEDCIKTIAEKKGKLFFLMLNDETIGYAMLMPSTMYGRKDIYLSQYYIVPSYRSQGYGTIFLEKLIFLYKSKGYKDFLLGVLEANKPAIALYKKMGFSVNSYNMGKPL